MATPFLWLLIGAGLGGFFGLEALGFGGVGFLIPLGVVYGLARRARRTQERRNWLDLAGFLLGAALIGLFFAIPDSFNATCSSFSGAGGCDSTGKCWSENTSTGCSPNYFMIGVSVPYAASLASAVWIANRTRRVSSE